MRHFKTLIFLFLNLVSSYRSYTHGFGAKTFVKVASKLTESWQTIDQLYNYEIDQIKVRSYHPKNLNHAYNSIKLAGTSKTNCYMRIWFDEHLTHVIMCTPSQEFYVTNTGWLAACHLRVGQKLFRDNQDGAGKDIAISKIEFIKRSCPVYIIEVDDYHTFLVGQQSILTHNMPLGLELFFGISVAFGEGAVAGGYAGSFFGPVTIGAGACILGLVGVGAYLLSGSNKPSYKLDFNEKLIEQLVNYNDNLGNQKSGSSGNGTNLSPGSGDKEPDDDDKRKSSDYKDITESGACRPNIETDVTKNQFKNNLESNGWDKITSKDGKCDIFTKDGAKYVIRNSAKSTNGPTADYYKPGSDSISIKIRLAEG